MSAKETLPQLKLGLEDYEDLKALRDAKQEEGDAKTSSLSSVREELGI